MSKDFSLSAEEILHWQARPAPRCYTFRHWRHSLFGFVFLGLTTGWQIFGFEMADQYASVWFAWLPLPFLVIGLYLSVGHLLQARLEWNNVRYAITNRRLLVMRGLINPSVEAIDLTDLTYFRLERQGEELGTVRVHKNGEQQLVLHCIEYPHQAVTLLEAAIARRHGPRQ
jgi:hypothetical protein